MAGDSEKQWMEGKKVYAELVLVGLAIVGAVMDGYEAPFGKTLLMFSMLVLATYYFLTGLFFGPIKGAVRILASVVINLAASICVVGVLFGVLNLHGSTQMLLVGIVLMGIGLLGMVGVSVYRWHASGVLFLIRGLVIGLVSVFTFVRLLA